jgi:hypothetical protein
MTGSNSTQQNIDLSGVYPELTPEQLAEAEYNLTRYVDVLRRIYERVNHLTGPDDLDTL